MRIAFCTFCFLALFTGSLAQEMIPDTILNLSDVTIYSSRISHFAKGQDMHVLDSLTRTEYPNASLADILPGFSSVYIRNYGQGTLSTISFRGTSANHTGLLWNGIRISPPNIGYVDLSLVQANCFENISLLYGGASPMFGSGSIGGGIHLENRPVFESNRMDLDLSVSLGSFGLMAIEGGGKIIRKKFYSRTAFTLTNAINDFSFVSLAGEKENLTHAKVTNTGLIQDFAFQLPNDQHIMASIWFQYAKREIPPTLSEESSEAVQTDRSWRSMLLWKDYNSKNTLEAKLSYFNEYTLYDDPMAFIYSSIKSQTANAAFESTWDLGKKSVLFAGTQYTYEFADLVNYSEPQVQQNLAIFGSYRYNFSNLKWQISLNGRQEFLTDYNSPFLFSAGAEGSIWRFISGRLNVSRNFRAPTFNERYWQPGGNPDLEPEESWNEEAGISLDKQFSSFQLKVGVTAFNSRVKNWILWLPGSGGYWLVENAQEVWSRGLEISGNQSISFEILTLILSESYTYSKSTNEKKQYELDASYKKQLIYTPIHHLSVKSGVIYKGFYFAIKGAYSGEVFTSKDNLEALPPYFLMDVSASKSFKIEKKPLFTLQLNINNVLNNEYQVTPYRPMPGINFLVTVKAALGDSY